MRTLPLFIVVLILVSILTSQLFTWDFLKYFFLVQKILPNLLSNDYYPITWSLSIEEFFYLLFPLILIFSNKNNFINKIIYFFILITLFKFIISFFADANYYRTGTLLRFDAILVGFIVAHYKDDILKKKNFIFLTFIILITIYLLNYNFFIIGKENPYLKFSYIIFMQATSIAVMLFFILLEPLLLKKHIRNFSLLISQQTYSIYLFHMILIYLFNKLNLSSTLTSIIYIIILFCISTLIYKFFEEPIMRLRPKIL